MSSLLVGQSVQELLDSLMACGPLDSSPPPGATLTEPADQDAALASWAARLSAERGLPDPTVAPDPTGVEPGADPLLHALVATGVSEELTVHLAATVRACARSCSPATTTGTPDATSASTLRDAVSGQEAETLDATATRARASELLGVVQTLTRATAQLEEVVLASTLQLTAAHAKLLLADKGLASPDELNATDRDRWRADAKSLTRGEIAAATGWGRGEVSDLVALANTPFAVTGPVHAALGSGEAPWRLARRFHRAAADLPHELAAEVANGMFGSDPAAAVSERLDSAGKFTGQPWSHREFYRALDREIEKAKAKAELQDPDPGPDPKGKSRARLLAASDLWVTMDPDGTASVGFRCSATQAAAIAERIEAAARRARAGGDKRSLNVLRATIATALLLHGTLVKPTARVKPTAGADNGAGGGPDDQPALIDIEHSEELDRILDGLPSATINILVPLTTLLPHLGQQLDKFVAGQGSGSVESTSEDSAHPTRADSAHVTPENSARVPAAQGPGVGEVLGKHPHFLTGSQIRELALTPGTSLFRILTDPVTGRYVERSATAYRFDAAMRRNIAFADVTCRAPGCTVPAAQCEFDHVQEFGTPGGDTSEANGALLHGIDHQRKTEKLWDAIIHPNRDVTWTSMLGRIYRTKAHDYNQYTALLRATTEEVAAAPPEGFAEALDRAVYAALSYRPARDPLEAEDDDAGQERFPAWDLIGLRHRDGEGRQQWRPDPEVAQAERQRMAVARGEHPDTAEAPAPDTDVADTGGTPWAGPTDDPPPF